MGKILVPSIKAKLSNTKLDQQQALVQYKPLSQSFIEKCTVELTCNCYKYKLYITVFLQALRGIACLQELF